jgi:hypothetical protein
MVGTCTELVVAFWVTLLGLFSSTVYSFLVFDDVLLSVSGCVVSILSSALTFSGGGFFASK